MGPWHAQSIRYRSIPSSSHSRLGDRLLSQPTTRSRWALPTPIQPNNHALRPHREPHKSDLYHTRPAPTFRARTRNPRRRNLFLPRKSRPLYSWPPISNPQNGQEVQETSATRSSLLPKTEMGTKMGSKVVPKLGAKMVPSPFPHPPPRHALPLHPRNLLGYLPFSHRQPECGLQSLLPGLRLLQFRRHTAHLSLVL